MTKETKLINSVIAEATRPPVVKQVEPSPSDSKTEKGVKGKKIKV